jgi:hypothetical protein
MKMQQVESGATELRHEDCILMLKGSGRRSGHAGAPRSGHSPGDHTLWRAYRFLTLLLLASLAAALLLPDHRLAQQFAPNAATEVLGIIITLAFVQQLLYRQERARRMRSSIGAYRRSGWALTRLAGIWADTIKGCHRGDDVPRTIDRLFAPHVVEVLTQLDPRVPSPDDESVGWGRRLGAEMAAAIDQLNRVVLSYSSVLDPAYTEAVDEIIDHPFVKLIGELTQLEPTPQQWRPFMNRNRGHREDFFSHLLATVHLHNSLAAEAAMARSRGRSPRTGTLGMELSRDHDLHVPAELSAGWRAASPQVGSLLSPAA